MGKELTLEELASGAKTEKVAVKTSGEIKSAKQVSVSDIVKTLPKQEEPEPQAAPVVANAFEAMTNRLQESKDFIENEVMPVAMENARELAIEKEISEGKAEEATDDEFEDIDLEDEVEEETTAMETPDELEFEKEEAPKQQPKKVIEKEEKETEDLDSDLNDIDDLLKDLDDEDDEFTVDEDTEETVEEMRARFKEKLSDIKIAKDDLDLSTFTISKNAVSPSVVLNTINERKTSKQSDWPLLGSNRPVRMEECSGPELDALRKTIDNSNSMNGVIASLKLIYNHIIDPNKPSFETWCKTTKTEDLESLYFALYKACYGDVNLVGVTCENPSNDGKSGGCGKTSIINIPIMDMVKFEDDETKEKFEKIMQKDTVSSGETKIKSTLIMASDDIAISYSEPTLYTTFIQFAALPPNITNKYSEVLNSLAYINGFYIIDRESHQLRPINVKVYPNKITKTVIAKLKVYTDILKALNNDQYNILTAKLGNLIKDPKISYIYPELTCPECGATIPQDEIPSTLSLLFTRAQLAQIKSL